LTAVDVAIGLDTSCYTTSVAAVDAAGNVVASQRMLLPVQSGQRGLRQSEAVFAHVRQMPALARAVGDALGGAHICAVASSYAPTAREDSYMPVFTVGAGHAETLAGMLGVPCYRVSHQQGHIAAGQIGLAPMGERFVALHLSGGTTELLLSDGEELTLLGQTLDLHAGQIIDRVGVRMGLPFPAGPALEALAMCNTEPIESLLPANLTRGDLDCHFSGAETRCRQWIEQAAQSNERIAAETFDLVARTVARMLTAACKAAGVTQILVVGGVASSMLLRELVTRRLRKLGCDGDVRFGKPEYSGDNAAGVALLGMRRYLALRTVNDI
jgi:N6-L-threonylcarbamoyladenine synthase